MRMQEITRRQNQLMRCIVHSHIEYAAPVSSDQIVRQHGISFSPATIRNEMANLESQGFLSQPHASAGRVPTDKGYRLYVDSLMRREKLTSQEQEQIRELADRQGDVHEILEQASMILGQISNELAVVLTPFISHAVFDRLEMLHLSNNKVLVVIHIQSRSVKTLVLQIDSDLSTGDLECTASFLNERLSGLTLDDIKNSIRDRCRGNQMAQSQLVRMMIDSADDVFDLNEPLNMCTSGTNNILSQPEFSDKNLIETLFEILDDRKRLSHLLQKQKLSFQVVIGQEHEDQRLQPFSIISARYQIGSDAGSIGIIGPKRMRYSKLLPLVARMADTISIHLE